MGLSRGHSLWLVFCLPIHAFPQFPNVVSLISVTVKPLRLEFWARPSRRGNNAPILCFANEDTLLELDAVAFVSQVESFASSFPFSHLGWSDKAEEEGHPQAQTSPLRVQRHSSASPLSLARFDDIDVGTQGHQEHEV
jgi:hypothetical protein